MIKTICIVVLFSLLGGVIAQDYCTYTSTDGMDYYIPNIVITEQTADGQYTAALCMSDIQGDEEYTISSCAPGTAICFEDNNGGSVSYGSSMDVLYADYVSNGQEELGVEITFGNGDACSTDNSVQTKTIITFVCDPSTDAMLVGPIATSADDACVIQFQLNSSSACPSEVFCNDIAAGDENICLSNPFCEYDTASSQCEVNPDPACKRQYKMHVDAAHVVGIILSTLALFCCFVGLCVCVCASCARRRCQKATQKVSTADEHETLINMEDVTSASPAAEVSTDAATSTADDDAAAAIAAAYGAPAYLYYMPQDAAQMQMQMQYMQYAHLNPYAFMVPQEAAVVAAEPTTAAVTEESTTQQQ